MLYIVESKCNKPMLLLDTFRYTRDNVLSTTIYWKCENRSCPERAIQIWFKFTKHEETTTCDEMKCKVEEFRTNLKRGIEDSPQPVKRIYREQLISLCTTNYINVS